uniref:collagen alpha-1(I) chain-like n=1 Tax=Callithrix jacchus TaxID=9483 RepID=UPI0023DD0794|nr:collagen alpha-1(I) chain-like [Callithrix jacchus]
MEGPGSIGGLLERKPSLLYERQLLVPENLATPFFDPQKGGADGGCAAWGEEKIFQCPTEGTQLYLDTSRYGELTTVHAADLREALEPAGPPGGLWRSDLGPGCGEARHEGLGVAESVAEAGRSGLAPGRGGAGSGPPPPGVRGPRRGRRGREVAPRALGPAARPGRSRRGAPGPPSRRCLPGRLRSAGARASAAAGGERRAEAWAGGRPEGGKEEGGEKGWEGGTRRRRRREGARQRAEGGSERARQAGGPGGREGARAAAAARAEDEPGRGAAAPGRAAGPARPHRPHGNQRRCWRPGRPARRRRGAGEPGGGHRGGQCPARGRLPDLRNSAPGARGAGTAGGDGGPGWPGWPGRRGGFEGLFMSPRARQAPPPVPPAPGADPPLRPRPAPGSSSSLYNATGGPSTAGLRRGARLGAAAGAAAGPPPPSGLCPRPVAPPGARGQGAGGRRPRPRRIGPRGGPGERGRGRGPGPAQAPRRRQKMAAWHDPAPRPSPRRPALLGPARRGTREAPGGGPRGDCRAGPESAAPGSSSGHLWLWVRGAGGSGRGGGAGESARLGGTPPRGVPAARRGGRCARLLPVPTAGRGSRGGRGGGAAMWGRGGGGRRSRAPAAGAGKRGGGNSGAEAGSGAWGDAWGRPFSPPHAHSHARGHTHAHAPRRAGADVSLKASHLHSEGRGLAAAAERGLRPHVPAPWETPSFRAAGGRGPCPALTPLPSPRPPCPPSPSARTGLARIQGPPLASPSPSSLGPAALGLPNCVSLS